jgi:hypothetical protein
MKNIFSFYFIEFHLLFLRKEAYFQAAFLFIFYFTQYHYVFIIKPKYTI